MKRAFAVLAVAAVTTIACSNGSSGVSDGTGATGATGSGPGGSGPGGSGPGGSGGQAVGTLWVGGSGSLSADVLLDGGATLAFGQTCVPPGYTSTDPIDGVELIDGQGNLWAQFPAGTVGEYYQAPIYEWTASQLSSCASSHPAVFTLTDTVYCGGDGTNPQPFFSTMAFDAQGNLWGAETCSQSIFAYKASDLAAGGSLTASQIVPPAACGPINVLCSPTSLAFDSAGNLWVANGYSIIGYTPATVSAILAGGAGSPPADLLLTTAEALAYDGGTRGYYNHYNYATLAFDRAGDLWSTVTNGQGQIEQQIVGFTKAQLVGLSSNNTPTPTFTITETTLQRNHTFLGWGALAFDAQGSLWAGASGFEPNLYRFSLAGLDGGGLPHITATVPGDPSFSLAFDPIPAGLPLQP